ncbi:hypothetical protein CU633_04365 [Bacillus sp. V3-13]|uniref:hypothetical protein n=1 Tax=Bacillus sp. V3-13 TaxID=2053728 RepID=UPI000C76A16F|nr:hypothetical protein [Bacillus sp. V3-13]PLR78643.1 hypothetical protein CU633_04365 [Bacillus sp. V3-13]
MSRGIERDSEEKRHLWEDLWMPAEEFYIKSQNPMDKVDLIIDGKGRSSNIQDYKLTLYDEMIYNNKIKLRIIG